MLLHYIRGLSVFILFASIAFGARQVPLFDVPFSTYTNYEPLVHPKSLSYHYRSVCGRDTARFNTALRQLSLMPDLPTHVRHMGFDALLYFCEYDNSLSEEVPAPLCDKLLYYGNSYIYHEIYFRSFRATGTSDEFKEPASFEGSVLAQDIIDAFGGMKELFEELVEAASSLDGYGWVWLLSLPEGLSVIASPDYDGIHGDHIYAIFNIDLWEHAYIESHVASIEGYLRAWWNAVDWERLDGEYIRKLRQWSQHPINLDPIRHQEALVSDTAQSRLYAALVDEGILSALVGLAESGGPLEALTALPAGIPLFEYPKEAVLRGSLQQIVDSLEELQQLSPEGLWGAYLAEAKEHAPLRGARSIIGDVNGSLVEALEAVSPTIYKEVVLDAQLTAASVDGESWLRAAVLTDSIRLGRGMWVLLPGSQLVRSSNSERGNLRLTETEGVMRFVASSDIELGDPLSFEWRGSATLAAVQGLPLPAQVPLGAEIQVAPWNQTEGMSHRCRKLLTSTFLLSGKSPIPKGLLKCVRKALRDEASSKAALEIATYQLLSEACRRALGRVMVLEASLKPVVQDSSSLATETAQSRPGDSRRLNTSGSKQLHPHGNMMNSGQIGATTTGGPAKPTNTYVVLDGRNVTPKSLIPPVQQQQQGAVLKAMPRRAVEELKEELRKVEKLRKRRLSDTFKQPPEQNTPSGLHAVLKPLVGVCSPSPSWERGNFGEDRMVEINLSETPTTVLVNIPSNAASAEMEAYEKARPGGRCRGIVTENEDYEALLNRKQNAPDQFRAQHTQTLNYAQKMKETLTDPPATSSTGVNASVWDIHDSFEEEVVPPDLQIQIECQRNLDETASECLAKSGCLLDTSSEALLSRTSGGISRAATAQSKKEGLRGQGGHRSGLPKEAPKGVGTGNSKKLDINAPMSDKSDSRARMNRKVKRAGPMSGATARVGLKAKTELNTRTLGWVMGSNLSVPDELSEAARVMERTLSQNEHHSAHLLYRNYPTLAELTEREQKFVADCATSPNAAESSTSQKSPSVSSGTDARRSRDASLRSSTTSLRSEGKTDTIPEGADKEDAEPDDDDKSSMKHLFCFEAPQLTGRLSTTNLKWHQVNQDLLCASYGDSDAAWRTSGSGLVLFWSLKNPSHPERALETNAGVSSLAFSDIYPNLIAVGLQNGGVAIWDLRQRSTSPILDSTAQSGPTGGAQQRASGGQQSQGGSAASTLASRHTDAVWDLQWVDRGPDKFPRESLVSIGADGKVLQWDMRKGLDRAVLMSLKRSPNPDLATNVLNTGPQDRGATSQDSQAFRQSCGFCLSFLKDPSMYLVGTEGGLVHRCSTSYSEQYLETYYGHAAAVYKVRCNPFWAPAFLTCSADWTIKLWSTKPIPIEARRGSGSYMPKRADSTALDRIGAATNTPLQSYQSTDLCDSVNDIAWCPHNSTSFAGAMDDGRIELWDIHRSPLDPIIVHYPVNDLEKNRWQRATSVGFAPNSPVLVSGDTTGRVEVMRLHNCEVPAMTSAEQQERLVRCVVNQQ
ncbi:WD repeat domain 78 [Perkinsus olseni]|uniref:Dynein axonemal intermediate chain 4 n=2 Tax=Perkinsus olseni TaxID=32597 RepID=A0A7J6QCJ3_PEROL|nr:WD repeat domain 78 [Perkinsus olseni]